MHEYHIWCWCYLVIFSCEAPALCSAEGWASFLLAESYISMFSEPKLLVRDLSQRPRVPGRFSWHVSLPPPAKEECRCPWGKWKHLVLARPVHISAGPHELAGDACTEENWRPQRWPTSFLPNRPCRPQPRNTDECVLVLTKHCGENRQRLTCIQVMYRLHQMPRDWFHSLPVIAECFYFFTAVSLSLWNPLVSERRGSFRGNAFLIILLFVLLFQ